MELKMVKLSGLHKNRGQIKDVPKNPRLIKDSRYEKLKKSLSESPEMLELRELNVWEISRGLVLLELWKEKMILIYICYV